VGAQAEGELAGTPKTRRVRRLGYSERMQQQQHASACSSRNSSSSNAACMQHQHQLMYE
jgi:hypothetical protein